MSEQPSEEAPWQRLSPQSLKVTALLMVAAAIAGAVPTAIGISSATGWPIALTIVTAGAVVLIATVTAFDAVRLNITRYRVTDTRVEMTTGLLFKQRRSLARERIRSVDLTAHPLLRYFGVVKVKVGTGESGSASTATNQQTLTLDPVSRTEADRLRAELLRRDTTDDAEQTERHLATWQPRWLRYAPLSFLTPTLAAAAIGLTFQVSDWFGRGGLPVEIVHNLINDHGLWQVLGTGLATLLLLGVIGSLAFQGEAWWNHRLDREPGGTLRVRRGLLVSRSLSLEEKRIRGIDIVEPLGIRSAKAARLDVVAIGLKSQQNPDLTTLVPAAPRTVVTTAAEAVIGSTDVDLTPHPRGARTRRLRWACLVLLIMLATITGVPQLWSTPDTVNRIIVICAALINLTAVWAAVDSYNALGHGFNRGYLVTRKGSIRRSTVHLDRTGIIGWRIKQSIFQRRLGLATLDATTAAGKGHYAVLDADEHEVIDFADNAVPGLLEPFIIRPQPDATTENPR